MENTLESTKAELLTDNQLCDIYNLSKTTVRKIADEAGAVFMFGRTRRTDKKKFDAYIHAHYVKR